MQLASFSGIDVATLVDPSKIGFVFGALFETGTSKSQLHNTHMIFSKFNFPERDVQTQFTVNNTTPPFNVKAKLRFFQAPKSMFLFSVLEI